MYTDRYLFTGDDGKRNTVTIHYMGNDDLPLAIISDGLTVAPGFRKHALYVERFLALPDGIEVEPAWFGGTTNEEGEVYGG